jgi:hypothetical protein
MPNSIPSDETIIDTLKKRLAIQTTVEFERETKIKRQTIWLVKQNGWAIRSATMRRKLIKALFPAVCLPVEA